MKIQTILSELKKEGWFFDEEFIRNNEDMLQAIADKTRALQLQQTGVSGSVFEKYELEYIDHLVDTDFDLNQKTFSKSKIEKVTILLEKIKKLRLS